MALGKGPGVRLVAFVYSSNPSDNVESERRVLSCAPRYRHVTGTTGQVWATLSACPYTQAFSQHTKWKDDIQHAMSTATTTSVASSVSDAMREQQVSGQKVYQWSPGITLYSGCQAPPALALHCPLSRHAVCVHSSGNTTYRKLL